MLSTPGLKKREISLHFILKKFRLQIDLVYEKKFKFF